MPSNRTLVAGLAWGAVLAGCGGLADGHYQGEPLAVIQGTLTQVGPATSPGAMSFAFLWAPAASHESALNLLGGTASGAAPGGSYAETCTEAVPQIQPLCDGTAAAGDRSCDWTDGGLGPLLRVVDFQARLPAGFEIPVRDLPPTAALYDLSRQGGFGSFALASVVAFDDVNRDGAFRTGTPADPPEPTLVDSGHQSYLPAPNQPRRSYLVAYLDGLMDPGRIDPALAEVLLFLPQGFSVWVEDQWLDEYGRVKASGRLWQPIDVPIDLFWPTQAVIGCEKGTRRTVYRPDLPAGEVPAWCSDDRFRATWSRATANGCVAVEERYSGDFSCAGSLPPAWACPAPTTGSLLVSVATAGESLDLGGYLVQIDGGSWVAVGRNGSVAMPAVSPGTHTVAIGGVTGNCAVAGSSAAQVTVAAGQTAYLAFAVQCWTPGSIRVAVSTAGQDPDPDGFTVDVDGGATTTTGSGGTVIVAGVRPGTHSVALSGIAANCVVIGANPLAIDVPSGATVDVAFAVSCALRVGDVRVSTTTTGVELDPDGYTVSVFPTGIYGSGYPVSKPIAMSDAVLFQDIPEHSSPVPVALSGLARNCSVSGPNPQPANVAYQQTTEIAFAVECVETGSITVIATTTGTNLDPDGYLVTWSRAGQAETVALPVNGATTIAGLVPGEYQLTFRGMAVTCEGPSSATATVVAGAATPVAFDVVCWAGRELAFVSYDDGNPEIYLIRTSGTGATRLTVNPASDVHPAWSPDGARLAFASDRDGNLEIYVMGADGSNQTRLTNEAASDYSPTWSPDGTRIAFVSERDGNPAIYVMDADGSNPKRLTTDVAWDRHPAWAPDGSRIAFERWVAPPYDFRRIHLMNADGSDLSALPVPDYESDGEPDWSPDGTRIAFSSSYGWGVEFPNFYGIVVRNLDATGLSVVFEGSDCSRPNTPAWSPDGRLLAFAVDVYGGFCDEWLDSRILVVHSDGTGVADIARGTQPAWRP